MHVTDNDNRIIRVIDEVVLIQGFCFLALFVADTHTHNKDTK